MAMNNAERQRQYRKRHLHADDSQGERLNMIISFHAKWALARMAAYHNKTQKALLEQLLLDAESRLVRKLPPKKQHEYYDDK